MYSESDFPCQPILVPKIFYKRDDVCIIAQGLLGKMLVTGHGDEALRAIIVETEAYRGSDDKGCHSFIHGKTPRTEVMFEQGGCAYIYICYGMHHMVNVVTNIKDKADAVLIRAVAPLDEHISAIQELRQQPTAKNYHLTGGPGKVCTAMNIDKSCNGALYYEEGSSIRIYDVGILSGDIVTTPRVGMSHRVAEYANMPWRYYLKGNEFVSRPLQLNYDY